MLSDFGFILLFIIGGAIFIVIGLLVSAFIRPSRPNEEKLTVYECGEDPVGDAWGGFNMRFYVVALLFVLFDVELVFLFPWATVFGQHQLSIDTGGLWGWFALGEMLAFIVVLAIGLAFAWKGGYLAWRRPSPVASPKKKHPVPNMLYQQINVRYASKRAPKKKTPTA